MVYSNYSEVDEVEKEKIDSVFFFWVFCLESPSDYLHYIHFMSFNLVYIYSYIELGDLR